MKAPESVKVTETPNSIYWFENEVLFIVSRKGPHLPLEKQKVETDNFIKQLDGKKICAVIDVTNASQAPKDVREYNTRVLPQIFKAIAFVTHSAVGKMLAHLYFSFKPLPFPAKVFSDEKEAIEWIRKQG